MLLINGISTEDIRNMKMEDIGLIGTFIQFYKEQNNKEIAYWISKSIVGGK